MFRAILQVGDDAAVLRLALDFGAGPDEPVAAIALGLGAAACHAFNDNEVFSLGSEAAPPSTRYGIWPGRYRAAMTANTRSCLLPVSRTPG